MEIVTHCSLPVDPRVPKPQSPRVTLKVLKLGFDLFLPGPHVNKKWYSHSIRLYHSLLEAGNQTHFPIWNLGLSFSSLKQPFCARNSKAPFTPSLCIYLLSNYYALGSALGAELDAVALPSGSSHSSGHSRLLWTLVNAWPRDALA